VHERGVTVLNGGLRADVVLADTPPSRHQGAGVQPLLGVRRLDSGRLAAATVGARAHDRAPFPLPSGDSDCASLEEWFAGTASGRVRLAPSRQRAHRRFDQAGAGLFAMPSAIETEVRRQYAWALDA
jgi:hypothetical protein